MIERESLSKGILPCCGRPINKYFIDTQFPMCESCDCYWTTTGVNDEYAIRNNNAIKQSNDRWDEIKKQKGINDDEIEEELASSGIY